MKGKFITLEGIEGAGKSTQIDVVAECLRVRGVRVVCTREPGGTPLGEKVRRVLLDPDLPAVSPDAELLLLFAARAQHLDQVIKPALERGEWVVSDRFTDATYAYQAGGRGLAEEVIGTLETLVQRGLQPDGTLLFDVDPVVGLGRASRRGDKDRFESEAIDFFERARAAYLARAASWPDRIKVIDGALSQLQVEAEVRNLLADWP